MRTSIGTFLLHSLGRTRRRTRAPIQQNGSCEQGREEFWFDGIKTSSWPNVLPGESKLFCFRVGLERHSYIAIKRWRGGDQTKLCDDKVLVEGETPARGAKVCQYNFLKILSCVLYRMPVSQRIAIAV